MTSTLRATLLAGIATGMLATPAFAQDAPAAAAAAPVETAAADDTALDADTIIVTGTRRSDRTVADSTVPIDVIGAEAIQNTGYTETNRVLNQLVPSFNFPQPSITDGTDVIRPATLRGLGPDQTLVLVNGKRRHTTALLNINGSVGRGTAAVDINLIPSAALERVEVLRDGAAAQYGSDAIAGVINFQLRRAREGGRISVTYGQYESDVEGIKEVTGVQTSAPGVPVIAPDGTLALVNTGKDRSVSDGKTLTVTGNIGLPFASEGFINVTGEYRDRDPTNRTGYDPRRQFNSSGAYTANEFSFDRLSHRYGDARTEDYNAFINFGTPLAEDLELYAFASYGHREGESGGFYRLSNDARNVLSVYPNGFLPLINSELDDYSFTGGLKGVVGSDINVDVSMAYAKNEFDFFITNTLNASIGPSSKTEFDAGGLRYGQFTANLDLNRDFEIGGLKSFNLAGGLEYRNEDYEIRAGEPDSYRAGPAIVGANNPTSPASGLAAGAAPGAQVFPGFQPTIGGQQVTGRKRERHNFSAYVEVDADISDRFTIQAAGRYEDYSDFGSDWNGKVSARFEPIDGYAVRGAVSTGFRAPSLQQQFFAAAATNNVNGILVDAVTLPVNNPVAQALGASPLQAETSVSYSAGFVINPVPELSLTVDYYHIDIDDRIVVTENLNATRDALGNPSGAPTSSGFQIAQILNNAGFRTISAARFFINGIDTRTQGVDAVATYRIDLGEGGKLRASAGFNYNKTRITGRNATPGALSQVPGVTLFGRQESLRIEQGQPRTKVNLGLDYDYEILGVTLRGNRYGKVLDGGSEPFNDVFLGAKWVVDLEARIKPGKGLEFAIGANNLLDEYPDLIPTGQGADPITGATRNYAATRYVAPYSNFSPFGFNGRFLYARASLSF
ncbi:TonB-dependent receptor plug domain-containing protein [Glacieibacterium frigidum]|uniref:TonB-dependent receptor n=1 Tax=Glacieibacterium frigidum TaxID=2593303 RepID=A0A552U7D2_9SPHN|nr:TonB-dependent receptor [Glacieibacterium frigidum]TRW14121.1 TonB-dependent receptor [Glacieibacterium frigidum]